MATPAAALMLRRTLLAGAAIAALGTGALAAQDAQAAFNLARCQGAPNVGARGASFQATLHTRFKTFFESPFGCGGTPTGPVYTSTGSGDGRAAMGAGGGDNRLDRGVRLASVSFAAADEAPTPVDLRFMNDGPTASTADDGLVHTIPIATGASAFILHVPEGCTIADVTNKTNGSTGALNGADTGDGTANLTQRVRLTNERIEAAFAGAADADTWGEIAPGISSLETATGIAGDATNAGVRCAEVPVRRIVRQDSSGTTYGWKAYLNLVNPARNWTGPTYGATNTNWPAAGGSGVGTVVAAVGAACTGVDRLCSAVARGGGSLARAVSSTDGSIGYVDLATARGNGFDITPSAVRQDYTFWSPLEVMAGPSRASYAEPTYVVNSHLPTSTDKGASCGSATVSAGPTVANSPRGDPTLGDWSAAYAAGGNTYPACVLTYALAWDDNAPVYGNSASEEAKARTVKDYLALLVSESGQTHLLASDYSALPNSAASPIVAWAQNGVAAIDWNKTAGGGDTPRPEPRRDPVPEPRRDPVPAPRTPPSNAFSIPSSRATSTLMTFVAQLPGAGSLRVAATTRVGRRTIRVASVSASPRGAGRVTLRLKLSSAAKRALARAKTKKLKVTVKFTFTPTGGTARTMTKNVTVRAARRSTRKAATR
jgi:ABC-type phosphate transport system substrate-binding protein